MAALLILAKAGTPAEAASIAETLVAERLAACVQMAPVESWYRWQDKVERASECRLHIKTTEALSAKVQARVRALHSYDIPELIVVPIVDGFGDYLDWIESSAES